jgi:hypothetical protein
MLLRKVYGDDLSAQERTKQWILPTAIEEEALHSWSFGRFLLQFATNRTLRSPANEDSTKNSQKQ